MSSEAQIAANRRNAAKSTGPKTSEGKAATAQNAVTHGLTAKNFITFEEHKNEFAAFAAAMQADLAPGDSYEAALAERIILCAWRLRRAGRMEAALVNSHAATKPWVHGTGLSLVLHRSAAGLATLSRYEMALDRAMQRAAMMLERAQARRRGEHVPAPIAVTGLDAIASEGCAAEPENYETKPILAERHLVLAPLPAEAREIRGAAVAESQSSRHERFPSCVPRQARDEDVS